MNKKDAAAFLGVSTRAIERYTTARKLNPQYKQGKNGLEANYSQEELQKLKEEREQPAQIDRLSSPDNPHQMLQRRGLADLTELISAGVAKGVTEAQSNTNGHNTVRLTEKLTLDMSEAVVLSGLSRGYLTSAIRDQKLKAAKRGRGWNIKRKDLERYIEKL
jgi:excisionase family DNA binding protein